MGGGRIKVPAEWAGHSQGLKGMVGERGKVKKKPRHRQMYSNDENVKAQTNV